MSKDDKKKSEDKKLTDITVKDVEKFVAKVVIGTVIGVALLMLIIYLVGVLT